MVFVVVAVVVDGVVGSGGAMVVVPLEKGKKEMT